MYRCLKRQSQLRQLWIQSGRQGADKLYNKAVREGLNVKRKDVQEFVKSQESAQVFQPRIKSEGKVVATGPMKTWQIDIVDFKQFDSKANNGFKYILVAIDIFDRRMMATPQKTKSPEETLKAFKKFAPFPDEVDSDNGAEWGGTFEEFLDKNNIGHREKNPKQINALAVSDKAISTLKSIIAKGMTESGSGVWYTQLKKAVTAYNNTSHSHLMGSNPNDVKENKVLTYELKAKAGEDIKHNFDLYDEKLAKLKSAGAFRTMLARNTWTRVNQPRYSDKVHKIKLISGADVIDTDDNRFPIKLVLPVPSASKDIQVPTELKGGRPAMTTAATNAMKPFSKKLLQVLGTKTLALQVAGRKMNEIEGFKEAMKTAKIIGAGAFRRFLQLFPNLFKIEGTQPRMTVKKA